MEISDGKHQRTLLLRPLLFIIVLTVLSIGAFHFGSQYYTNALFKQIEKQNRLVLTQIVSIARNAAEPVMKKFRAGQISRDEAVRQIRMLVRTMIYTDRDGKNYIFMSAYDGTMLVQPYEPAKEMTDQWNLRDANGLYIIRELVKAAKTYPDGSFVSYYYHLPGVHGVEEKLAYVVGLPELQCYIGTGMYMEKSLREQKDILAKVRRLSIWLLIAVLIPIFASVFFIYNRNRQLLIEAETRRKAQETLYLFKALVERSTDAVGMSTPEGRHYYQNEAFSNLFGDIGENPRETLYVDRAVGEQVFRTIMAGDSWQGETRMFGKDGKDLDVFLRAYAIEGPDGCIIGLVGLHTDITARKKAQEALRQSEQMFRGIIEKAIDIIYVANLEGIFTYLSPTWLDIMGEPAADAIGKPVVSYMHPDDVPIFRQSVDHIAKTGEPVKNVEFRGLRRDGAVRWLSTTTAGLYDSDGKLTGFMGITRDVTEKKLADEERQNLQEELVQAQKLESIGRLAGGVAHDFNNILMGIQGNASLMLLDHTPEHPHYQRLSRIEEHVQRGAKLTRQLLGFARGGKYEVKTLAINDLIRKSAGFFIETRKEIEAFFELQEELDPVDADAGQMEQVLLNIFINAVHAMPGGGQLHIRTANVVLQEADAMAFDARPGNYIKISISDTGIGMDKETLEKVFEPFFTTRSKEGGSGLGLASAYGIVRNHGGIIHAYSEPGHGTMLTIYLPSSERKVDREDHAPPKDPISGKGVILIIDDEPLILDSTKDLLEMLGYTVYCAASGQEGTAFYMEKKDRIDLVVLDMILPGMSGSQVLKMLKANNPGVKVILSSGYSLQGEVQKVMDDGCIGFIQKPFNLTELSTIIHQALHPADGKAGEA